MDQRKKNWVFPVYKLIVVEQCKSRPRRQEWNRIKWKGVEK